MARQVRVSTLAPILEGLTGFPILELSELHMTNGRITFITAPHPVTNVQQVGTVMIVPDEEPEPAPELEEVETDDESVESTEADQE